MPRQLLVTTESMIRRYRDYFPVAPTQVLLMVALLALWLVQLDILVLFLILCTYLFHRRATMSQQACPWLLASR
jgi:hypothetical protein